MCKKKPEWIYIKDMLIEAYHDIRVSKGRREEMLIRIPANFFNAARWMNLACRNIEARSDKAFKTYKAHGRRTENRNKALIALASSYELCFGEKPTSAGGGGFYESVRIFLQCVGLINCENEKDIDEDKLADDTVTTSYQGCY